MGGGGLKTILFTFLFAAVIKCNKNTAVSERYDVVSFFFFGARRGQFIEMELSTWRPQASFLESQDWRRRFKCTCYYLPLRQLDTIVEFFHHAGSPRPRLPSRSAGGSWPRTSCWSCATSGPCHATSSCRIPGHKIREEYIVK